MGSIVAILFRSAPPDPEIARKMLSASPHRGLDFTVKIQGSCVLGVSNVPEILDSSISRDGDLVAAFTGRLDNSYQVVAAATARGFTPSSENPADVVVAAFRAFGPDAPERFRGAFAVVITDGRALWCFRDHIGLRACFYRRDAKGLFIGSEAKQVLAGSGISREPDLDVLERIFYGRLAQDTPSALKGIDRLRKATVLHAKSDAVSLLPSYWRPDAKFETARISAGEVEEAFSEMFRKVIARSLTGEDVIAMSGGIDSPAVAAYAAPLYSEKTGRRLSALSHVYPDHPKVDERRYIELIANFLKMDLHTCTPTAQPWDNIAYWCEIFDGPIHTLSLPEISEFYRTASSLRFHNLFTGDVAEVVFDRSDHLLSHLLTHGRWKALGHHATTLRKQGISSRAIARTLITTFIPGTMANWYLHLRGQDFPERIPDWLDGQQITGAVLRQDLLPSGRERWTELQLGPFLHGAAHTLEADDVCGLMYGVSIRRPFADVDTCEFFLSLPAEVKFPDMKSKTLMRRMLRGKLPDAILDRRDKTVFNDYFMSRIDYASAKRFLVNPSVHIPGVKYDVLATRIERQDFNIADYVWANDLIRLHAFLSLW